MFAWLYIRVGPDADCRIFGGLKTDTEYLIQPNAGCPVGYQAKKE